MYLQKLQLHGFKSFVNKVTLNLDKGITVIVGPNGSGKSNVVDALRWVLGEQSIKSLRGNRQEDIIFAGTKNKRPMGMAEVTIVLDNTSGLFPLDYSQISISRKVFRDGESQFFINKNPCRLKDVQNLFVDTGLGKNAFAIIGQGRVDDIINSSPEDRRPLFEEAAGVTRYKNRKKEALQKLSDTENSLLRVDDIILEMEEQLPDLRVDAEKAKCYLEKTNLLKSLEFHALNLEKQKLSKRLEAIKQQFEKNNILNIGYSVFISKYGNYSIDAKYNLDKLIEKISIIENKIGQLNSLLEKYYGEEKVLKEKVKALEREILIFNQNSSQQVNDVQNWENKISLHKKQILEFERKLNQIHNKIDINNAEVQKVKDALNRNINLSRSYNDSSVDYQSMLVQFKSDITKNETKISLINKQLEKIIEQITAKKLLLQRILDEEKIILSNINKINNDIKNLGSQFQDIQEKLAVIQLEKGNNLKECKEIEDSYYNINSRLRILNDMEEDFEGYFPGVKYLLSLKKTNPKTWDGLIGSVAQILDVPSELVLPIETALGSQLQNLITRTHKDAEKAISILKEKRVGKVTFLPLNTIKPKILEIPAKILNKEGFIGLASDLIKISSKYKTVLDYLLGRVLIVDTLQTGMDLAKHYNYSVKIVSLDGQTIMPGGSITGGYIKVANNGILSRKKEIRVLKVNLKSLNTEINIKKQKDEQLSEKVLELQEVLKSVNTNLESKKENLFKEENCQKNLKEKIALISDELDLLAGEKQILENERAEIQADIEEIVKRKKDIEEKFSFLQEKTKSLNEENTNLNNQLNTRKEICNQLQIEEKILQQKKIQVDEQIADLEIRKNEYLLKVKDNQRKLEQNKEEIKKEQQKIAEINLLIYKCLALKKNLETVNKKLIENRLFIAEKISQNQNKLSNISKLNEDIIRKQHLLDLEKTKIITNLDNINNTIKEQFDEKFNPMEVDQKSIKSDIVRLKNEISELGQVNIGAIEHYEKLKQRVSFLQEQKGDLIKAKETLNKVISEINNSIEEKFYNTFIKINEEFSNTFKYLFDGGTASLYLTKENDILNTGIDINAQPPGKKLQNINLLSGGEKALTAIALLFSFLKIKPSPFCVLDEIEAALDEINEQRFSNYLKELSKTIQFLVVSHKQNTMLVANNMYGITTEEPGISKVISIKLSDSLAV